MRAAASPAVRLNPASIMAVRSAQTPASRRMPAEGSACRGFSPVPPSQAMNLPPVQERRRSDSLDRGRSVSPRKERSLSPRCVPLAVSHSAAALLRGKNCLL